MNILLWTIFSTVKKPALNALVIAHGLPVNIDSFGKFTGIYLSSCWIGTLWSSQLFEGATLCVNTSYDEGVVLSTKIAFLTAILMTTERLGRPWNDYQSVLKLDQRLKWTTSSYTEKTYHITTESKEEKKQDFIILETCKRATRTFASFSTFDVIIIVEPCEEVKACSRR
ncbi:hypothetical protein BDR04DRAFT_36649 [Suillus decipiens]|nr:hypothetical protein BDR04DRAFT_36649 [Suillus decipiens]